MGNLPPLHARHSSSPCIAYRSVPGCRQPHCPTRWWFLRGLGVIYPPAFMSMHRQVDGLIGSDGILPAAEYWCRPLSVGGMFFCHFLLRRLIFAPRRVRLRPFCGTVLMQVIILAAGTYCFSTF